MKEKEYCDLCGFEFGINLPRFWEYDKHYHKDGGIYCFSCFKFLYHNTLHKQLGQEQQPQQLQKKVTKKIKKEPEVVFDSGYDKR